jgi:hypothetical protein
MDITLDVMMPKGDDRARRPGAVPLFQIALLSKMFF